MRYSRAGAHSWAVIGKGDDVLHSYGANQGYVIGDNASLVVDTGFDQKSAVGIKRNIPTKTKTTIVLNTHYHSDHVFGNGVFTDAGVPIIAHARCSRSMRTKSETLLSGYRERGSPLSEILRGVRIENPHITYSDRIRIHLGGEFHVDIIHPGFRAHTDGDSMAFVPEDRVLFAGDILWVGYHPNLEDADIQGQIRALRMILRLKPHRIVPGHGPVSGVREVRRLIRYLEEFDSNSRTGLRKGLKGDELVRHVIPRWSRGWKMKWLIESYVRSLVREN